MSAAPSSRWHRILTSRAGAGERCRVDSWRGFTGSRTRTAAIPTHGRYLVEVQHAGKPADVAGHVMAAAACRTVAPQVAKCIVSGVTSA